MPAKPAAAAAAPPAAAPVEPPPPEDDGPLIDARALAVAAAWRLIDKEHTTFAVASDVGTFFAALGIFPTEKELREELLPSLEPAGARRRAAASSIRGARARNHLTRRLRPPLSRAAGEPVLRITFAKAEARALALLRARSAGQPSYEAPSAAELLAAFRSLDPGATGAAPLDRLRALVAHEGRPGDLSEAEFAELLKLLPRLPDVDGEPDHVSYDAYVARAVQRCL